MSKFLTLNLIFIVLSLFLVFSFTFHTDLSFDQDLGRHIRLGEVIFQTGSVPKTNLFSYTNPDYPFINHHFLFEIYVFLGQKFLGIEVLLWIKTFMLLVACYLSLVTFKKRSYALFVPVAYIFFHDLRDRTELRPEIFSFLFTAATLFILERWYKMHSRLVFLIPFIQLLWINTHIYFAVGFILQGIYFLQVLMDKKWQEVRLLAVVISGSLFLSFLNPNGLKAIIYPLTIFGNYGYSIQENQSLFLLESINFQSPTFLWVKLSWVVILISFYIGWIRQKITSRTFLLGLGGMGLSLLHVRSFPYLVFLSLPAVLVHFETKKFTSLSKIWTLLVVLALVIESYFYLSGIYYKNTLRPVEPGINYKEQISLGVNFLLEHKLPGPIFNNFDIGSYLIYKAYPRYKVFVDGRPEAYPKEFFTDSYIPIQYDYSKFKKAETKYKFQTIIFSHADQTPWAKVFLKQVVNDPNWSIVYIDSYTVIFTKTENLNKLSLKPLKLDDLRAGSFNYRSGYQNLTLGIFCYNTNNYNCANSFLEVYQGLNNPQNNFIWW